MIRSGSITVVDLTDIDTIENWYLATDQSSGVTRDTEGWTTTVQMMDSSHPYLWTYEITKGSGNVVINTTEPVIIGRYGTDGSGTDGRGIVQIDEYYATNNSTTEPVDSEFTTEVVNPTPINKYLWNYAVTTYTDSTTESTEKRIIGVYGDKPVITSNPKQDGVTTILADGTAIATIADGTDGHSPTITTSKAAGSTTTKILADGVEIGSVEDGDDGHSPVVTASKSDGVTTIQVDGNIVSTINDGNSVRISSATKQDGVTTIVLTDESGSQTLTIVDGEDGSDGQPGRDGVNSYLHIAWANDTNGTDFSTSDSTNKLYMGTYSDSTIADSTDYRKYNWSRIKGEQGATGAQGTSVVKTEIEYYMKVQGGVEPDSSTTGSTIIPNYEPGSTYYKRTVTYLSDNTSFKGNWIQDTGLTNEIKNAYDAWFAAGTAELRTKKIITDSSGVTVAAGVNGADVTEGTTSTYGYNTIMAPNYLGLRYNDINLSKLTTTGLDFYIPTVNGSGIPIQGAKGLSITSDALTFYNPTTSSKTIELGTKNNVSILSFYNPSNSSISMMDLTSSGLVFKNSAGAELGKFSSTGLEMSGTLNIKGGGRIGQDSDNYWKFGDYISYKDNSMAYLLGYGESSIQLGETGHWRLDKNRIHTGWYQLNDDTQGQLHFDTGADDGSIYYWDYGMHYPDKAGSGNNKFLYIRRSSDTTTSVSLATMKGRIDDDTWWTYKFYIDGDGNLHAGDIYSNGTLISGTSAPYLLKSGGTITGNLEVNGTLTKGSKNVAYLTATPTSGQILIADGTSGGIKSSGYTIATSVPSGALFTDKKVQTSQANTTRLYLVGTNTLDTSTDVLNFDSNIYADTTAGALHATTYNGYTLAAASAKGVDTSMPATATDSNVPTTKLMKSFVEEKGYIATETDPVFVASAAHGITSTDISNWNSKTSNTGTVTSVRVQASSPLQSSVSTAQSTSLDTTVSFVNQNKNLVLAGPSTGSAAAPTFRSLVADDIPGLAWSKITSGKPTTLSGYGITDAAGSNALVGLSANSNDAGVTTFTATRASGKDPLSFEVSIVASAAAGANALRDSEGPISKGSATKPVYFSNGVPAEANTYAGGTAITLNNTSKASSTASFYAPTSGGTTSQVLVGNGTTSAPVWTNISSLIPSKASTADAFSSAAEVKLTGDTTGSASSTKGWSISTTTTTITPTALTNVDLNNYKTVLKNNFYYGSGGNGCTNHPKTNGLQFGMSVYATAAGHVAQELSCFGDNANDNHGKWIRWHNGTSWSNWEKFITSINYTDYTVTKTGTGASGTWAISISGNAATATKATQDASGNTIASTYVKKTGDTMTGPLKWNSTSLPQFSGAPNYLVGIDGFADGGTMKWQSVSSITVGSATKATQDKNGNDITTKYVTVDTDQTITASQKTFNGAIRWGNASKYGAAHYDSTLEAIVFSFA